MTRFASYGRIETLMGNPGYPCKHEWPEDCSVQCGDQGLVFAHPKSYYTAFFVFEAFPRNPDTFIRGEGETIEAAEEDCWQKYQKTLSCPGHEFEDRGRKDGAGWCKHCRLFSSKAFVKLLHPCCVCGELTHHIQDTKGLWYCFGHGGRIPDENLTPDQLAMRQAFKEAFNSP